MDETTASIISRITRKGGEQNALPKDLCCSVFYDCLSLTPNDLARLAAEATGDLSETAFDAAVGIAYTGMFFAAAVAGGQQVGVLQADGVYRGPDLRGKKVVVVDDVVHTGGRLQNAAAALEKLGAVIAGFAVIVDRSDGTFGSKGIPLWSAHQTCME